MMAARRVVRITEVRVTTSSMKDTLKEDCEAAVQAYLANPCPSSIVIFVADELNGNRKLGKLLKSHPAAVEFCPLDDREIRKWAQEIGRASCRERVYISEVGESLKKKKCVRDV